ncbi:hypothetical protein F5X68DRAFT_257864 [Plectosphaerella plurivora]|uniref:SnoaL-like domain-containing protein n=1 Tax=Plectosphaerella plurivora TaxID=936078 RepID=A0A9P8VL25_9PEZI|nr:hypothetical protein F5X68DRAFT_257864 [Plectosphaerella plurivora]
MSYVTKSTKWLADDVDRDVKALIAGFYELADLKSDDAGPRMASHIFSSDAVLVSPSGTFKGAQEISNSRANAWTAITSRRHVITRVFSGHNSPRDMVLLGSVNMHLANGETRDAAFSCHIKLAPQKDDVFGPRIGFMVVYPSPAPVPPVPFEE